MYFESEEHEKLYKYYELQLRLAEQLNARERGLHYIFTCDLLRSKGLLSDKFDYEVFCAVESWREWSSSERFMYYFAMSMYESSNLYNLDITFAENLTAKNRAVLCQALALFLAVDR